MRFPVASSDIYTHLTCITKHTTQVGCSLVENLNAVSPPAQSLRLRIRAPVCELKFAASIRRPTTLAKTAHTMPDVFVKDLKKDDFGRNESVPHLSGPRYGTVEKGARQLPSLIYDSL